MVPANLVVEDELSERIVRRLLKESQQEFAISAVYTRGGYGFIRNNISRYNAASRYCPFIVMTDLDTYSCPSQLIADWLQSPIERNLLFRIAVREPEAWVLADSNSCAKMLGIPAKNIPLFPEGIADPKLFLLGLAARSRYRRIREGMVRIESGNLFQGGDYNGILAHYVSEDWDPSVAQDHCPSLKRMRERLDAFTPRYQP
jgi:hypothetical protein